MTARTRFILAIVGAVLVAVAFFFLFVRPRQAELAEVRENIEAEEARTLTLQSELQRLQALQENAPELEASLARFRQLVPNDDEVPNLIFLIQDAANAAGVDFVRVSPELPKPPPEGAPLAEIRFSVGAGGGYFSIQDFVRRLYDLDRALRLDNFNLTASEDTETGEVRVVLESIGRVFFEPPVPPAVAAPGTAAPEGAASPEATQETTP